METKFGKILAKNRRKAGITQDELVYRVKNVTGERIERTYMSKLEGDKSNPAFSTIAKLCEGLGMTLAEFFGGEEETKEPAVIIYKNKADKEEIKKHRIKGEMVPIKVIKDITAFSTDIDIKKEFATKYIYVEKDMFDHPENIIGYEIDTEFKSRHFSLSKPILFIDIVNKSLDVGASCIVETRDKDGKSYELRIVDIIDFDYMYAFFDPLLDEPGGKGVPLMHTSYSKDEFDPKIIRGKIVGVIGRF